MPPTAITFIVPGDEQAAGTTRGGPAPPTETPQVPGRVKQSVRVGTQRSGGGTVRVVAEPGKDVVVLKIAGGPALTLHPETARDLLMAQAQKPRARGARGAETSPTEITIDPQLRWRGLEQSAPSARGATRGLFGDVVLSGIEVITDLFTDAVKEEAADFVATKMAARVDSQVDPGVYCLPLDGLEPLKGQSAARIDRLPMAGAGDAHLVLIHGTFSNTSGTFGKLWSEHPTRVRTLFKQYGNRVYGLDHPTLALSPIANALALAEAVPSGARLHLLTHSRGGLVAEVLARVANNPEDPFFPFANPDHAEQREQLRRLAALCREKRFLVDRVVRVACPARGTLLASKRLDAYVSILKWALELAGIPVVPALIDFLGAVAQRRADPAILPGLSAQIPDSPLMHWLHGTAERITGDLRVVAGDVEGDSIGSWVKTLLSDSFYWTDNDFVVQTRSMYGGSPRAGQAQFLLHQGGKVSHFDYFRNELTADAICNALVDVVPAGFQTIGPLSWAGEASDGARAARRSRSAGTKDQDKPAVFLLPGILGSNLKVKGERVWLAWRMVNGLDRLAFEPGKDDGVAPDGPIGTFYDRLAEYLADTHEVVEFAFDWRRSIEDEAKRLAKAIDDALDTRKTSNQPVRIIAHSMGGLVARTVQIVAPDTWQRLMGHPLARLLMLGTPNGGSWSPMQVLSGDDTFGNALAVVGAPFRDQDARMLMARFPGFIQLQASLLDPALKLDQESTWQKLADADYQRALDQSWWHRVGLQLDVTKWGVPPQAVLDTAVALRQKLDKQRDLDLAPFSDKLLLVVGRAALTPEGFEEGVDGFVYRNAVDTGDGRVPIDSARLPGVKTWKLDCEHGSLPSARNAFAAYEELLRTGTTNLLEHLPAGTTRGAEAASTALSIVRNRPSRTPSVVRPPQAEADVVAALEHRHEEVGALTITVSNGDLKFIREPLMIGHYRSERLTGTESVMNRLIGGAMDASLKKGLYPDQPGTHQLFINNRPDLSNPWQVPRPEAVIVVGLGQEGKLDGGDLIRTVRQAVIAWSQRLLDKQQNTPTTFGLAATLIGTGGPGVTVGQAAQLIAQGVSEANARLKSEDSKTSWALVKHLHLIELYMDRASEAWRALKLQAASAPDKYVVTDYVQPGLGALPRPLDSGYRGADYDYVVATTGMDDSGDPVINYTLDTKRARSEIRAQAAQGAIVHELVGTGSNDRNDTDTGQTLFKLMVPSEMESFMAGSTELQIELDQGTAAIPWELLTPPDDNRNQLPWAIRAKLLRKLRTETFREQVDDAGADAGVLVIGEPACNPELYPELPSARREAEAVAASLRGVLAPSQIRTLIRSNERSDAGPTMRAIITTLMSAPWRIVHIAGHGEPPELIGDPPKKRGDPEQKIGDPRGVVLSDHTFLGPREIRTVRPVPELVFVNCCYLATSDQRQLLKPYNRSRFASGVAEELIRLGVKCVVAAGWAVADDAAMEFARTFYDALLRGERFIEAVGQARVAAYHRGGNTWAAYQCYGDPDWMLTRTGADPQRPSGPIGDEFSNIASARGLLLALRTLAVRSDHQGAKPVDQRAKLQHLEMRFASLWGDVGHLAEAFGMAWLAVHDEAAAIRWLERAATANDGSASIRAIEQLANIRSRVAWYAVLAAQDALDRAVSREAAATEVAQSRETRDHAIATARAEIDRAVTSLTHLATLQPSAERETLLASAYKRLTMVERIAGRQSQEQEALRSAATHYEQAETLAREHATEDLTYSLLNQTAARLVISNAADGPRPEDVKAIRTRLDQEIANNPTFWTFVQLNELTIYEALGQERLTDTHSALQRQYADVHERLGAPWLWKSVHDQMLFVLSAYIGRDATAPPEKAAARAILDQLKTFAHTASMPVAATATTAKTSGARSKSDGTTRAAGRSKSPPKTPVPGPRRRRK